jgi:type I restriction enzyme, S subunit
VSLPRGWSITSTSEACAVVQSGGTPKAGFIEQAGIPFLKVYNIVEQKISFNYRPQFVDQRTHEGELRKSKILPGDVLMNIVGPPLGKVAIVPSTFPEWNGNQALTIFRPSSAVISDWLYYFLCGGSSVQSIINETRGSAGQVNISLSQCRNFKMPLPPLPEQQRIVNKIDSLSAKPGRARDHLDHILRLVEKYKQAILAAAFKGELTRPWREARRETSTWRSVSAGTIIESIVAGKNLRCEERPPNIDEKGVLKVSAVTWGSFDPLATKTLPKSFVPPPHTRVQAGDFLISRANTLELVGAVVIVNQTPPNLFLSDKILRLQIPEETKPWLLWFLRSPNGRSAIEASATGNQLSMRNLSQSALRQIELPWPGDEERREIIRSIEKAFAWIDRLSSEVTNARKLINHLDQAILAKALRGELVPQDPNDEPASILLERIKAERLSNVHVSKETTSTRPKKRATRKQVPPASSRKRNATGSSKRSVAKRRTRAR